MAVGASKRCNITSRYIHLRNPSRSDHHGYVIQSVIAVNTIASEQIVLESVVFNRFSMGGYMSFSAHFYGNGNTHFHR